MHNRVLVLGGSGFLGTYVIEALKDDYIIANFDINPPIRKDHNSFFRSLDILDFEELFQASLNFQPDHIILLAGVTTQDALSLDEFSVNILGTDNAVKLNEVLKPKGMLIVTSSQHINTPGETNCEDLNLLKPYGFYGYSKYICELITIASTSKNWVIVRPTLIWGPDHPSLPKGLWSVLQKNKYLHPKNDRVIKTYGYVENTAQQYRAILESNHKVVEQHTFYLGDEHIYQYDWVNSFSKTLSKKNVREVPLIFLRLLSIFGENLRKFLNLNFPLYKSRYVNLTTSNIVDISPIKLLETSMPISLQEGTNRTCEWLESFEGL